MAAGRRGGSRTRRRARQVTIAPGEATVTLHFLHLGRTGGTAIQRTLRGAGFAYWKDEHAAATPETPFGRIQLHRHRFRMRHVPSDDFVFFCLRDPIARYL